MAFKEFREYLLEEKFSMNCLNNKIEISNYEEIDHFDNNKIIIKYSDGMVLIEGKNLIISKLMKDAILIKGNINKVEFK